MDILLYTLKPTYIFMSLSQLNKQELNNQIIHALIYIMCGFIPLSQNYEPNTRGKLDVFLVSNIYTHSGQYLRNIHIKIIELITSVLSFRISHSTRHFTITR